MIGPNTLIATVSHPLFASGRRKKMVQAKYINIGNDVWLVPFFLELQLATM